MDNKITMAATGSQTALNRRQALGTVGAVACTWALSQDAAAAPAAAQKCTVRVATVSYSPPFHDYRAAGVNLTALRDMTAKVMKDRPDFICFPEVGAAVCFDANFDFVAAELERQKAQLVFWPSMYWGGQLLQHWALRYGFAIAAAYGPESAVIDMNGRYLAKIGNDTLKVRQGYLPPWAMAEINVNRELFHLDDNQQQFPAIREKYGPDVEIEVWEPEGYFLLASRRPDLTVEAIAGEFHLEPLRDYLARSVALRNARLPA